jgi:hypothetical protein
MYKLVSIAALALCVFTWFSTCARANPFDGVWKVRTVTEINKVHCVRPPLWRYKIKITQGQLAPYDSNATEILAGSVQDDGTLRVSIRRGDDRATAEGKLVGDRGSGTWQSDTRGCSGTWTSERTTGN